uniref:Tyrosine-protein kinase n=1 Tax=Panagrolaimus davidi TaxID=227884 RepID=A0A914QB67_9BILA
MTKEITTTENASAFTDAAEPAGSIPLLPLHAPVHKVISSLGVDIRTRQWYHGFMTRREAEILCRKDGQWLVRVADNQQVEVYCISVRFKGKCFHTPLSKTARSTYFVINDYLCKDPMTLIQYHYEFRIPLNPEGACLKDPVQRQTWSLQIEQLKLGAKLGHGEYGDVYAGELLLWNGKYKVAIKQSKATKLASDFKIALLREAFIMRRLNHPHVLRLFGVQTIQDPIMIVFELAEGNSLDNKLKNQDKPPTPDEQERYVYEIVDGMQYLESQWVVHKDLAARNCLIDAKGSIKIGDFGLSIIAENIPKTQKSHGQARLPARWMAPEVLVNPPDWSSLSDVWSYGVVIYEIYTFGTRPYHKIKNQHIIRERIRKGTLKLEVPEPTPPYIAEVMSKCFLPKTLRPSFKKLKEELKLSSKYAQETYMQAILSRLLWWTN